MDVAVGLVCAAFQYDGARARAREAGGKQEPGDAGADDHDVGLYDLARLPRCQQVLQHLGYLKALKLRPRR